PGARTHLDHAKNLAKNLIDRFSSGGESVAIVTAARPATALLAKPGYDLEAAKTVVDHIQQSYSDTDLAGAIQLALQIARDEGSKQPVKSLELFTDSTRSSWEGSAAQSIAQIGLTLPQTFAHVAHFSMAHGAQWNQAMLDVKPAADLV